MNRRFVTRIATSALLVVGAVTLGGSPGSADGPRPGLPDAPHRGGQWISIVQGGASETKKAKQWMRVPMQVSTIFYVVDEVPLPPEDPRQQRKQATNYVFLMAEPGAPQSYGLTAPFTVRTVAFGSVPVSATVRLAQLRDDDDLPIPIKITNFDDYYPADATPPDWPDWPGARRKYHDTEVDDHVSVQVMSLTVDGVDLDLRPGCITSRHADLSLFGKGFIEGDPDVDPREPWRTGNFIPGEGGLLTGTVDVPPFANCVTSAGEDISALLTATVSGSDNAVFLRTNSPFKKCTEAPLPQVGEYDATAICPEALPDEPSLPPL